MPKHWTQFENPLHHVHKLREQFLKEHERADQIVVSHDGIPLQAIYNSPECPQYGKTEHEEPRGKLEMKTKDVSPPSE